MLVARVVIFSQLNIQKCKDQLKTLPGVSYRHYELVSKFSVGLKTLLHQGLSEPEFYGDLVYKFKKIVGRADFSDQFKTLSFVTNVLDIT